MLEETTAVEPQQQQPGLQEAFSAGHDNNDGDARKKAREPREAIPAADTQNESEDDARKQRKLTARQSPTLEEAFNGAEPEEVAGEIPEELQRFSADDIAAAMNVLGLSPEDLKDPRWLAVLEEQLQASAPDSEEDTEEAETEDEPEKKDEPKPPEEQKAPAPVHAEMQPEDVKAYVSKTWERAQEVSSPQMSKLFADSLATALGTPPENRELLDGVVGLLNYGGVSLIQSTVPALVTDYLRENLAAIMEAGLPPALEGHIPGIKNAFDQASIDNGWVDTMESPEFKGLNLPRLHTAEFGEAMQECCDKNPWFLNFVPTGPNGERLPNLEALRVKMVIGARLMAGQRITPEKIAAQVSEAIATGKRSAEKSTRRVSASGMLGRGRTTGAMGQETSDRESLVDAFRRGGGGGAL